MTIDEIRAAWQRWAHRNDVAADLAAVEAFAAERIHGRLMRATPEMLEPEACASAWLHAGLVYLHELLQDDEGGAREVSLFDAAITDFQFRWSLDNVTPDMRPAERET